MCLLVGIIKCLTHESPSFDVATVITEKYNSPLSELNEVNYSEGYEEENYMLSSTEAIE